MSTLQKVNVLTLWDPGSGDVITTSLLAAGGIHHFLPRTVGTDSDLTANAATIPTAAWMKIELKGADACYIQIGTKIATVTGGAGVTDCGLRVQAHGLHDVGAAPHDVPVATKAALTVGNGDIGAMQAVTVCPPATDGLLGGYTNVDSNIVNDCLCLADGTAAAVADSTLVGFWLSNPFLSDDRGNVGHSNPPYRVSGLDTIWLALRLSFAAGSNITALTLTNSKVQAVLFNEVTRALPYRLPRRLDLTA